MLINPEYVKLLLDENKKLVGFGLAMPSLNDAVKKSKARLLDRKSTRLNSSH